METKYQRTSPPTLLSAILISLYRNYVYKLFGRRSVNVVKKQRMFLRILVSQDVTTVAMSEHFLMCQRSILLLLSWFVWIRRQELFTKPLWKPENSRRKFSRDICRPNGRFFMCVFLNYASRCTHPYHLYSLPSHVGAILKMPTARCRWRPFTGLLTQPLFKFQTPAHHTGHLVLVPKD